METFPFGEHFQAISRQKSSFVWKLWKWKDKNPCNACARYAREGHCKTISLRSIFRAFPLVRKNLPRSKKNRREFSKKLPRFSKNLRHFLRKVRRFTLQFSPFLSSYGPCGRPYNETESYLALLVAQLPWRIVQNSRFKIQKHEHPTFFYNYLTKDLVLYQQITKLHTKKTKPPHKINYEDGIFSIFPKDSPHVARARTSVYWMFSPLLSDRWGDGATVSTEESAIQGS